MCMNIKIVFLIIFQNKKNSQGDENQDLVFFRVSNFKMTIRQTVLMKLWTIEIKSLSIQFIEKRPKKGLKLKENLKAWLSLSWIRIDYMKLMNNKS